MGSLPQIKYAGIIREVTIGKPGSEIVLGGESAYNFYMFEGQMPHAPRLALQVLDTRPEEWATDALEPFGEVLDDPVAWAQKCVQEYGAEIVCLWLAGTDPNGRNLSADHAAKISRKVAEAVNVPLIVWGVSNDEKNTAVLKAVAEECSGLNLVIGPVSESNYKQIGAAAIAYKHVVAANSPIDINLAKQLNILLENLGVPNNRILIDPTTGSVGYGMEYCYSIMERIRQAALAQNDEKLQYPIINNIAEEVWKTKEAKLSAEDDPRLGNAGTRGVNLEAITAISALQAGSDLLILRHPRTLEHVRRYIAEIMVTTDLASLEVDLSLVPQPPAPSGVSLAPAPSVPVTVPEARKETPPAHEAEAAEVVRPAVEEALREQETIAGRNARTEREVVAKVPESSLRAFDDDLELSEEDLQALKEMAGMVRAVKALFSGIARLMSGPVK